MKTIHIFAVMLCLALGGCQVREAGRYGLSTEAQHQPETPPRVHRQEKTGETIINEAVKSTREAIKIDYKTLLPRYGDIFGEQMNFILNEYWSEDGNWKADMMNDATAFAPRLLFKIYEKTTCEELYNIAVTTCNYQKNMINDVTLGKRNFDINSVFGIYCLVPYMQHAKTQQEKDSSKFLLQSLVYLMDGVLLLDIDQSFFPNWKENKSIALPLAASLSLEFYEIEKQEMMLGMAKELIEKHEDQFFDQTTGLFSGERFGTWNSALGLLAYARAYSVTRQQQYLQKANALIENLRKTNPIFAGVLFDNAALQKEENWSLYFSTLLIYIDAFWELYVSTGDEKYKNSVKRAIDFAIAEFTLSHAYPDGIIDQWFNNQKRIIPFFSHDIRVINSVKEVAPSYCLGCTFYMLNHIWDYNVDIPKEKSSQSLFSER